MTSKRELLHELVQTIGIAEDLAASTIRSLKLPDPGTPGLSTFMQMITLSTLLRNIEEYIVDLFAKQDLTENQIEILILFHRSVCYKAQQQAFHELALPESLSFILEKTTRELKNIVALARRDQAKHGAPLYIVPATSGEPN